MKRRDWTDARRKVETSDGCRVCGTQYGLETAHTVGRAHDSYKDGSNVLYVHPDSIVPLCGPHHRAYDSHSLDLLGRLTLDEELDAVKRAGGIELARVRLCPSAYKEAA